MLEVIKTKDILNFLLYALSNGINEIFPDIPVIAEEVPDELPEECFLIGFAGEISIEHDFDRRYKVEGSFDITYILKKNSGAESRHNEIFSKLSLEMKIVSYKDILSLRLGSHKKRTVDNALHDICKFKTFLYEIENTPLIQNIDYQEEVL